VEFLDKLIAGCLYCRTPESYRLDTLQGVADKSESCMFSYREGRSDPPGKLIVDGHEIEGIESLTVHRGNGQESWLNCWTALRVPKDEAALEQLKVDIQRLKREFGEHYAFIPAGKIKPFINLLQKLSSHLFWCQEVLYSSDCNAWSSKCKALEYSYQREYRFSFGQCSDTEIDPYIIKCETGFSQFIMKEPDLKLVDNDGHTIWFDLKSV